MISEKQYVDYRSFELSQFKFLDEKDINSFEFFPLKLIGMEGQLSPFKQTKPFDLQVLGGALGFNESSYKDLLTYHNHRLKIQDIISKSIAFLMSFLFILSLFGVAKFFGITNSSYLFPLFIAVLLLFAFVAAAISFRFAEFLTLRFFSDSLSIRAILYIIAELAHCQNPLTPFQKKKLLGRIAFLKRTTRSIIYQYNLNAETLKWAIKHFQQIGSFIQEREKWIVAPKNSTLENLRQDFYHVALILISGNLGDFEYGMESDATNENSSNVIPNLLIGIPRVIIGLI